MILDMSEFMGEQIYQNSSVLTANEPNHLDQYLKVLYDRPSVIDSQISYLIRKKLFQLNYLIDKNISYKYFLEMCNFGTIQLALWMCTCQYGDKSYLAMRECFIRMNQDILYLFSTNYPDRNKLMDCGQFANLMNSLKMIQAMRDLKRNLNQKFVKRSKAVQQITPEQVEFLQNSFIYNFLIHACNAKLNLKFQKVISFCENNKIIFDDLDVEGYIEESEIEFILFEAMYDIQIELRLKYEILLELYEKFNF